MNELLLQQFYKALDERISPLIFTLFFSCCRILLSVELSWQLIQLSTSIDKHETTQETVKKKNRWKELKKTKAQVHDEWFWSFTLIRIVKVITTNLNG